MTWSREIKEKTFGGYTIKKRKAGYFGTGAKPENEKQWFDLWKDIKLDKAFEAEDINPFISATQKASQLRMQKEFKRRKKEGLKKIQRRFRKIYGKTITLYEIGKIVKKQAEVDGRKIEIEEFLKEIRADENLKTRYEGAEFIIKDGVEFAKLKDKKLKFDHVLYDGDAMVGAIPKDVTEEELWELYGDPTEQEI